MKNKYTEESLFSFTHTRRDTGIHELSDEELDLIVLDELNFDLYGKNKTTNKEKELLIRLEKDYRQVYKTEFLTNLTILENWAENHGYVEINQRRSLNDCYPQFENSERMCLTYHLSPEVSNGNKPYYRFLFQLNDKSNEYYMENQPLLPFGNKVFYTTSLFPSMNLVDSLIEHYKNEKNRN